MKILILVIYTSLISFNDSSPESANKMLEVQRKYHNKYNDVTTYFIEFRNQQNDIEIENDFIYIKGVEHILNILDKTIKAVEYLINNNFMFDFLIRTNISTMINIPLLISYCNNLPKENIYTGGNIEKLQWLDHKAGIINEDLHGTIYVQGNGIILSYDVINHIILNKHNLNYNIVDDVTLGSYINKYKPNTNIHKFKCPHFDCKYELNNNININNYILFRNRIHAYSENRNIDIQNMNYIYNHIYK